MNKKKHWQPLLSLLGVLLISVQLSGCSTYATNRYSISADNVVALKSYRENKIGVGTFSANNTGQTEIICRGANPIKTPDGEPFESFIRSAFVSEIKIAEAYSEKAPTVLSGNLNQIDFDSNSGHWNLSLTISSSNGQQLTISDQYQYTTSFSGSTACAQTAQALMPAVQNVITKLVQHEEFPSLVN